MTLDTLRLTRTDVTTNDDPWSYDIRMIDRIEPRQTKEAVSIAPPGMRARENILLGVSGQQADITITFLAMDDGTDLANGTVTNTESSDFDDVPYASFEDNTVETLLEQYRWLMDFIHSGDFGATWVLDDVEGDFYDDDDVYVETVDTPFYVREQPRTPQWRIDLRFGETVI